jgi:hypothetical protein
MKDESIFFALFLVTVIAALRWAPGTEPHSDNAISTALPPDACQDPRLEAEWRALRADEGVDPLILRDHALRIGLCQMLEQGDISSQQLAQAYLKRDLRQVSEPSF